MQPFIVSARKYRPNTFDDVVGQKHVAETLMHEITQNKLAQAFLFTGPRGVGKTTCARILAKVINSQNGENPDSDFSFNVFELDAASNNAVDDIRNLIDQVRIPPQVGKYKVYIIDEVHMLSAAAFNAFLKTLEEPPSYAIFILATTERHKILPTILSRCQVFNFNRIQIKDMVEHLAGIAAKESVEIEEAVLHLIAQKADGGLRDALSMFDQLISFSGGSVTYEKAVEMLSILDMETFFKLTEYAVESNITQTLLTVNDILNQGFDGSLVIGGFADHIRNLMVSKSPETNKLLDVADVFKSKYQEQSKGLGMAFLLNALNLLNEADERYKSSRNPRLLIELTLIKLCHLHQFITEIPTLEEVKKKLTNSDLKNSNIKSASSGKSAISDRVVAPSIKEDVRTKMSATRLGSLNPNAIKKKQVAEEVPVAELESPDVPSVDKKSSSDLENKEQASGASTNKKVVHYTADSLRLSLAEVFGIRIGALLKSIQSKIADNKLIFVISGKMQEAFLEEIRIEIKQQLKILTQSQILDFEFEILESVDNSRKPYTDAEKLNFLMEKHPLLLEAVEKLKLRLP